MCQDELLDVHALLHGDVCTLVSNVEVLLSHWDGRPDVGLLYWRIQI